MELFPKPGHKTGIEGFPALGVLGSIPNPDVIAKRPAGGGFDGAFHEILLAGPALLSPCDPLQAPQPFSTPNPLHGALIIGGCAFLAFDQLTVFPFSIHNFLCASSLSITGSDTASAFICFRSVASSLPLVGCFVICNCFSV